MNYDSYLRTAKEQDKSDQLASFRNRFFHNEENIIYLDGNSLGRMPRKAVKTVSNMMQEQWGERLIRSWNEHWMGLPGRIAGKLADLLGAGQDEIMVGDSTSLNLYKLVFAALKLQKGRKRIVSDSLNFPTDLYILQGLIGEQFTGHSLEILESRDGISVSGDQIAEKLDEDTALLTLSHVAYKSGSLYEMEEINKLAHEKGVIVIWDLSHSAGAVPVQLNKSGSDMAVGCTYKYLNGGPGAPAYLFVKKELHNKLSTPVWGWFGHEKPFDFSCNYTPADSVNRFAAGTPHILSMAPVEAGVDIILEAGMENLRKKSVSQTEFLIDMIREFLMPVGFELGSSKYPELRGSHVSVMHHEGYRINKAMIDPPGKCLRVIPDFRPPGIIRLGIAPLYISFEDIYHSVRRMETIVNDREYDRFSKEISGVT